MGLNVKASYTQSFTFGLPHCDGNPCDGQWTQHVVMEGNWDSVAKDYQKWVGEHLRRHHLAGTAFIWIWHKGRWVNRTTTVTENVKVRFYLKEVRKNGECCQDPESDSNDPPDDRGDDFPPDEGAG